MGMYNILGGKDSRNNSSNGNASTWDRMMAMRTVWANEQSAHEAKRSNDIKAVELDLADPDGLKRAAIAARRERTERERQAKIRAGQIAKQSAKIDKGVDNAIAFQQKVGHLNSKLAEVKYDVLGLFKK